MENFTPRERVMIAFEHQEADRVPLTELLIDPHIISFILGTDYKASSGPMYDSIRQIKAAMKMDLDLLPLWPQKSEKIKCINENTYADEFGRIWSTSNTDSFMDNYIGGGIKDVNDFKEYKLEPMLEERLPLEMLKAIFKNYPDYSFMMCHAGPYELTFESLGIENFCYKLYDDRQFIRKILEDRTDWFIELAIHAINAGVDYVTICDDAGYKGKPLISPKEYNELVVPCYRRIAQYINVPIILHSCGYIFDNIPYIIESGIKALIGMDVDAGMELKKVKQKFGDKLVLMGNVDCGHVLCQPDLDLVRKDVERCIKEGAKGGGYFIASSSSLHKGVLPENAVEMFKWAKVIGKYKNS